MKNTILYKSIFLLSAALSIFTSCETIEEQYINVDVDHITFMAEPDGNKTIKVDSYNGAWEVDTRKTDLSWLTIVEKNTTSLILSAKVNDTGFPLNTTITLVAGDATKDIQVDQMIKDNGIARYRLMDKFVRTVISPSGNYAGGFYTSFDENGDFVFQPYIIDMATDKWNLVGTYTQSMFVLQDAATITDSGELFLTDGDHGGCIKFSMKEAGDYKIIPRPANSITLPEVTCSAENGNVWVGYGVKEIPGNDTRYFPIKWTNEVPEELEVPELNYRNQEHVAGVMARGCSLDGSVIYGTTWDNDDSGMVYWKDGKVDYVWRENIRDSYYDLGNGEILPYRLVDGMVTFGMIPYQASASGKYICGTFRTEEMNAARTQVTFTYCPAFFNTETKELFKFTEKDGSAMCALDSGIGFIGTPSQFTSSGYVVEIETNVILGTIQEWIYEKYGIRIPAGYPNYISPDGSIMLGTKLVSIDSAPQWYVAPYVAQ